MELWVRVCYLHTVALLQCTSFLGCGCPISARKSRKIMPVWKLCDIMCPVLLPPQTPQQIAWSLMLHERPHLNKWAPHLWASNPWKSGHIQGCIFNLQCSNTSRTPWQTDHFFFSQINSHHFQSQLLQLAEIQRIWKNHISSQQGQPMLYNLQNCGGIRVPVKQMIVAYRRDLNLGNILS